MIDRPDRQNVFTSAEWLQGQTATRGSAVAAARRLIADGSAALLQKKTSELSNI